MEWRIFHPVLPENDPPVDLWPLLGVSSLHLRSKRTDIYISCTEGVGLKVRASQHLEIKLRGIKSDCGAEQWSKVCDWT